jgi:predicted dehydrogenase
MNNSPATQPVLSDLTRRDFVKTSSIAGAMAALGGVELFAADEKKDTGNFDSNAVLSTTKVGVIGCNEWGREILNLLARIPKAEVIAVCDHYEPTLNRAKGLAPKAEPYSDYKKLLENKDVQSVIIATPTHQHKDIVLAALAANKHVYCEAPLANTIEDARIIARAARDNPRSYFQCGQLMRSDPSKHFLLKFVRSGAAGTPIKARAQWHKKNSWRRTSPNEDRNKEVNWRLQKEISVGLVGEIGVQQLDVVNWMLNVKPNAVTGFGGILLWQDGREVDDTVQAIYEYPNGMTCSFEATLANSFDSEHEVIYGSDAAIMARSNKAWMFKETDAPLLGWEVYARKDVFYNETGIALVANASKSADQDTGAGQNTVVPVTPPLEYAIKAFVENADLIGTSVEDFAASFDIKDTKALREYLAGVAGKKDAAGFKEGFEAAVVAIKGAEAVVKRARIQIPKDLFEI